MNAVAKTKTLTTDSPFIFSLMNNIRADDARLVAELHAYAIGEAMESYSFHPFYNVPGTQPATLTGSTIRSFEVWIPPWAIEIEVYVDVDVDVGVTDVDVDISVGSDSTTISLSNPWEDSAVLLVDNIGDEYQLIEIGGDVVGGTGDARLSSFRFRVLPIAASDLPDPS